MIGAAAAPSWIGLATAVVAAAVSAFVGVRQSRMQEKLARLPHELEREDVLTRYREPLAGAAFDLQSRLYNVLRLGFFAKFDRGDRGEEALRTTVFRLAQYFGWTELLRRDIQFLSFSEDGDTRRVAELQREIAGRFLSDRDGSALMIWSDEQRAIGERMIVEEHGKVLCMGYATFRDRCDDTFGSLRGRLVAEVGQEPAQARLRDVQHLLCDLVEALDPRGLRYAPHELTRA
jgi:HAMP domain-containing protein